ncbi:MAG: DotU family type IV/VI secretion system protein [Thermodesulfobacteriota bacterium]
MENRIMAAARPVIDYLLGFRYRLEAGEQIDSHSLRADIVKRLGAMEATLQTVAALQPSLQTIKYIMTGFADEVILSSAWSRAKEWHDRLLEMEFFRTSVVGERFYDLLESEGYRDPELAELFYTLLVLGFRGRYRNQPEKITSLKLRVYPLLANRLPDDERRLTPGAEHVIAGDTRRLPKLFGLSAILAVLVVSFLLYFTTSQWMWNDIAGVINEVSRSLIE